MSCISSFQSTTRAGGGGGWYECPLPLEPHPDKTVHRSPRANVYASYARRSFWGKTVFWSFSITPTLNSSTKEQLPPRDVMNWSQVINQSWTVSPDKQIEVRRLSLRLPADRSATPYSCRSVTQGCKQSSRPHARLFSVHALWRRLREFLARLAFGSHSLRGGQHQCGVRADLLRMSSTARKFGLWQTVWKGVWTREKQWDTWCWNGLR